MKYFFKSEEIIVPNHFNVFLDTNIFIKMRYDFSKSPLFRLKKYASLGIVNLFTNEIVVREVGANIRADTAIESAQLKNAIKKHCFREILSMDGYEALGKDFREEKWDEIINTKFRNYLSDTECTVLTNENIGLNEIFDDYFHMIPPFENREEKKHEFPDAVIIKSIKNYVSINNTTMLVITDDDEWNKAFADNDKITIVKDLKEALTQISSYYGEDEQIKYLEFLGTESSSIIDHINDWLFKTDWDECLESDISLDVLGVNDFDVESIKLVFDGFEFVGDEEACVRFKALSTIDIEYEYDNYDYASYDREDGVYYNVKHGTVKEKHICPVDFTVSILRDGEDMNIRDYEFEDIVLSQNTEVCSEVCEDTDEPDYDDEYFAEKTYTTCPDCGNPIGLYNDGLNGFCDNCGKNH